MLKAYKYRIYPTTEQQNKLTNYFGCNRFIYNLGLETKISTYISAKINVSCFDLMKQMTELKKDLLWLKECPSQTLQASLCNLDNAYTSFFRGQGFPKFKNKYKKQSISFPQGVSVNFKENKIFIPKLKIVDCIFSKEFKGNIKTVTVSN